MTVTSQAAPMTRFPEPSETTAPAPAEYRGIARDQVRLLVGTGDGISHTRFRRIGEHLGQCAADAPIGIVEQDGHQGLDAPPFLIVEVAAEPGADERSGGGGPLFGPHHRHPPQKLADDHPDSPAHTTLSSRSLPS